MKKRCLAFFLCVHTVLFMMFQAASNVMAEEDAVTQVDAQTDDEENSQGQAENSSEWLSYEDFMLSETTKAWNDPAMYVGFTAEFNTEMYDNFACVSSGDAIDYGSDADVSRGDADVTDGDADITDDDTDYYGDDTEFFYSGDDFYEKLSNFANLVYAEELFDAEGNSIKIIITDYYFDDASESLWYKVEAAEGYTLPDVLVENPYVLHLTYPEESPSFLMHPRKAMFVGDKVIVQKEPVAASRYEEVEVDDLPDFFDITWSYEYTENGLSWYDFGDISGWAENLTPEYRYISTSSVKLIPAEVSRAYEMLMTMEDVEDYNIYWSQIPEEITRQFTDKHLVNLEEHQEYLRALENVEYSTSVMIGDKVVPVTVRGKIPQTGVTLNVSPVSTESVLQEGFDIEEATQIVTALDIKIINDVDGTQWQPDEGDRIWVSIGVSEFGYEDGSILKLQHKHGEKIDIYDVFVVIDGKVTVGISGFSMFVVTQEGNTNTNGQQVYDGGSYTLEVGEEKVFYFNRLNGTDYEAGNWFVTDVSGAIHYTVHSNSASTNGQIDNNGVYAPWIKIDTLKETTAATQVTLRFYYADINQYEWGGGNIISSGYETYTLNIVPPKATAEKPKKIYLKDEVNTSGCIVATLVDVNGNVIDGGLDGAAFSWKRMDGTREMFIMPQAYENGYRSVNIARDHGGLLEAKKDANGKYIPTIYAVTAILADGTELDAEYTVYYQSEIINAGFEAPDANASTYTFFPNGWEGMYWETTGPGTGVNLSRDIEYVDFTGDTNNTNPGFGVSGAAEGVQFAELNAEAFGTLYQDIITAPEEEVVWSFAHAPRPDASNKMYIVMGPTEGAQKLTTQEHLEALADVARATKANRDILDAGGSVTVKFNEDTMQADAAGSEYTIWYHEAKMVGQWDKIEGAYITPDNQYRTRVFFMSETPMGGENPNYGNMIDAARVGQYKSYLVEYYVENFHDDGTSSIDHMEAYDEFGEALIYSTVPLVNLDKHFFKEAHDYLHQILINGENYPYNIRFAGDTASIYIEKYEGTAVDRHPATGKNFADYDIVVQIYLRDTVIAVQKEIDFPKELTAEQKLKIIQDLTASEEGTGSYKANFHLYDIDPDHSYSEVDSILVTHRDPAGKYTGFLSLGNNPELGHMYTVEETSTTPIVGLTLSKVTFKTTMYNFTPGTFEAKVEKVDYIENQITSPDVPVKSTPIDLKVGQQIAEVVVVNTYKEKMTQVFYQAVGNGKVALIGKTDFADTPMETLAFYSGKAIGGAIHPGKNATFVGWFKDEACTEPVTAVDGVWNKEDNTFKPNANIISKEKVTFYAKFETGAIVIDRTDAEPGQVFVYHVQGTDITDGSNIGMYVTVECDATGNGSRTIYEVPSGNYTVTELLDWSWRYPTETIGPTPAGTGEVTFPFGKESVQKYWLNGYSGIEKNVYSIIKGGS